MFSKSTSLYEFKAHESIKNDSPIAKGKWDKIPVHDGDKKLNYEVWMT